MGNNFLMGQGHELNAKVSTPNKYPSITAARIFAAALYYIAAEAIDAYRERTAAMERDKVRGEGR